MQAFNGLEDVVAAHTCLSHVDGARGELIIAGWPLEQLVQHFDYSATAALLWQPFLPELDAAKISFGLGQSRLQAWQALKPFASKIRSLSALDALRLGLDLTADLPELEDQVGVIATLLSAFALNQGSDSAPDPHAEPIADLLRQCQGLTTAADPAFVKGLTRYLVSVSDHGLNASTFTARVIASTASDLRSSLAGALGALKGSLHGGAPGPVLDMLDAIGTAEHAKSWIQAELSAGQRIMGFGHRIYRVRDPRADVLKATLEQLSCNQDLPQLQHAAAIEQVILASLREHKPDRVLETNVEFYTALLLDALGFDRSSFTGVFALGRALGWVAHAHEQQATGRLIRPQSVYVGPKKG